MKSLPLSSNSFHLPVTGMAGYRGFTWKRKTVSSFFFLFGRATSLLTLMSVGKVGLSLGWSDGLSYNFLKENICTYFV